MKPVCDHAQYCKNDKYALYLGHDGYMSKPSDRDEEKNFPQGWSKIKDNWFGVCGYTGRAKAQCNFPANGHGEQSISERYNTFVCGRAMQFRGVLGKMNGLPERKYTFQVVKTKIRGKRISNAMVEECSARGMKPVCDHPSYCRNDKKALYIGQKHHIAYRPHRQTTSYFPKGWKEISGAWDGMCSYTAGHGTGALCNYPLNTHSWQHLS